MVDTDQTIVDLFWERDERGLKSLQEKYNQIFQAISYRILNNSSDAEECVNDAYFKTWNSIPQARPDSLLAYTGKIVRNLSIDRLKRKMSQKRMGDDFAVLLSELEDCIVSSDTVEAKLEYQELAQDISTFLKRQKKEYRHYFLERYWYACSIKEIAEKYQVTEKKVESVLYRCRKKLREFLVERGYFL